MESVAVSDCDIISIFSSSELDEFVSSPVVNETSITELSGVMTVIHFSLKSLFRYNFYCFLFQIHRNCDSESLVQSMFDLKI